MNKICMTLMALIICVYAGVRAHAALNDPPNQAIQVQKVLVVAATSIASSGTTTPAIATQGLSLVGIQLPATFTGTTITFQGSVDGTTYQVIKSTTSGTSLSYTVAQATYVAIDPTPFYGLKYIKLVSGSTEGGARSFSVALKGL